MLHYCEFFETIESVVEKCIDNYFCLIFTVGHVIPYVGTICVPYYTTDNIIVIDTTIWYDIFVGTFLSIYLYHQYLQLIF